MKKFSYWILSAAMIVGLGVGGFHMLSPQSADAIPMPPAGCYNTVTASTSPWPGQGSSCAAARSNGQAHAVSIAQFECEGEICSSVAMTYGNCLNLGPGGYVVESYGTYQCALFNPDI